MKATVLISLIVLLLPLSAQTKPKTSPADSKPATGKEELLPNQKAFLNLPEEKRNEWVKHMTEANRIFQQKRIIEANEEIDKAVAIFKDSAELYNLRGSCYVEMRAFDKAMVEYQKAADLAKNNPNIDFNIGEVYFVTKQWQKCVDTFEKVLKELKELKDLKEQPADKSGTLGHLMDFKIMLCKMKLGKMDEAKTLSRKYDELDDSPFYYYAKAALDFEKADMAKAEEWLQMAGRIFQDPNATAPWKDTLVEYGYIKGLYGTDIKEPEEK